MRRLVRRPEYLAGAGVFFLLIASFAAVFAVSSCKKKEAPVENAAWNAPPEEAEEAVSIKLKAALQAARIPAEYADVILGQKDAFFADLQPILNGEPALYALVDKAHSLPDGYEPDDLVTLTASGHAYQVSREGLRLRAEAAGALERMAEAAAREGVTLTASSTYRSYKYQVEVYQRTVAEMGQEAAGRVSARPGRSQHQTGLVIDFGSISDAFARTDAGRWMLSNAGRFGWSLSFPDGYEERTGYKWESWHYRYVGVPLAVFITKWFGGIQQFALEFIYEWNGTR